MLKRAVRPVEQLDWLCCQGPDCLVGRSFEVLSLELWLAEAACMHLRCRPAPQELRHRRKAGHRTVEVRRPEGRPVNRRVLGRRDRGIDLGLDQGERPIRRVEVSYSH